MDNNGNLRQIVPHWNSSLVVASIAVSFLGAFTSTQLIVQAKTSRYLFAILVWSMLASLTFGFCTIWSLHFIATLACELDLPIQLDPALTALSAFLAVCFTWLALTSDLLWERHRRSQRRHAAALRRETRRYVQPRFLDRPTVGTPSSERNAFLAIPSTHGNSGSVGTIYDNENGQQLDLSRDPLLVTSTQLSSVPLLPRTSEEEDPASPWDTDDADLTESAASVSSYSGRKSSRRSSGVSSSDPSIGLGRFASVRTIKKTATGGRNAFYITGMALYTGLTCRNISKGFVWSLAITGMHYSGIKALKIPNGYCSLNLPLVMLSALISWVVCAVGCILLGSMETRLGQQLLFSIIATIGVACMHFTGMRAADFWSTDPPSADRGYPTALVIAIGSIAIVTCLAANGLLAHSATVARNKFAEIVHTRKNLWAAIAQKENAEAAALARSEFIASASHEIRSPIHQLQGYSDLLARANLDDESRLLLHAIQDAIRSLSLITTTVLDWSRLEKGEAICRPTAVDVRKVCESVLNVLPSKDEDSQVELLMAVSPSVPESLFIDETYLHRIIMNLLSNALKFTSNGFVMLQVRLIEECLIVTVEDTGSGIPESFLPDLFEPFKQAQSRGPQRGTGLGLSIVKQLLSKMGGSIDTQSKDKHLFPEHSGTTFTATIPVQLAEEDTTKSKTFTGKLAVFGEKDSRSLAGISSCLSLAGGETLLLQSGSTIPHDVRTVWVSLEYLRDNMTLLHGLRSDKSRLVLLPCESDKDLANMLGSSPPGHFLPIRRPLNFHKIVHLLNNPTTGATAADTVGRTVRFASVVDLMDSPTSPSTTSAPAVPGAPPSPPSKIVMLVEDNKINQRLGSKMLTTLGYGVLLADDGQHALDLLEEHQGTIDAVLMDQSMPRMDGLTATREIRAREANGELKTKGGHVPIIAVTAVVGAHAEAMCRQAGTDDFLAKPLSLSVLRKALETWLGFQV